MRATIKNSVVCRLHAFLIAMIIGSYSSIVSAREIPVPPPFTPWLERLKTDALKRGIKLTTLSQALKGVKPIPRVIELDRRQPEFTLTFSAYFKKAISENRITQGRVMMKRHADLLKQVEARYGV